MNSLTTKGTERVAAFWAAELNCSPSDLAAPGTDVVTKDDGHDYVHLFRRGSRLQISCSSSMLDLARDAASAAGTNLFDVALLKRLLAPRVGAIIGPTFLGYLDEVERDRSDESLARLLTQDDLSALSSLRARVSALEWEHGGPTLDQPIAGCFVDGRLVSAAGYRVIGSVLAHVGVVTDAAQRGRGFGKACARIISRRAADDHLVVQYQTLHANHAAIGIAKSLGFVHHADRIFVRAKQVT